MSHNQFEIDPNIYMTASLYDLIQMTSEDNDKFIQ